MKRTLMFGLVCASTLAVFAPTASAAGQPGIATFVGCDDLSDEPIPSHVCEVGDFPGAYFESSEDIEYEVCVEFPDGEFLCAEQQFAEGGVLYVNSITTDQPGIHTAYWFVGEEEVGSFVFRMDAPPPPPAPPTPPASIAPVVPPAVAPVPVVPGGSAPSCIRAQAKVSILKGRLKKATGRKQKAKTRAALKAAKAYEKKACGPLSFQTQGT